MAQRIGSKDIARRSRSVSDELKMQLRNKESQKTSNWGVYAASRGNLLIRSAALCFVKVHRRLFPFKEMIDMSRLENALVSIEPG